MTRNFEPQHPLLQRRRGDAPNYTPHPTQGRPNPRVGAKRARRAGGSGAVRSKRPDRPSADNMRRANFDEPLPQQQTFISKF